MLSLKAMTKAMSLRPSKFPWSSAAMVSFCTSGGFIPICMPSHGSDTLLFGAACDESKRVLKMLSLGGHDQYFEFLSWRPCTVRPCFAAFAGVLDLADSETGSNLGVTLLLVESGEGPHL